MLNRVDFKNIHLLQGLFKERSDINRKYLMQLSNNALLQNFYIEAGIVMPALQAVENPADADLHWGWEAPICQLRGHFLGHWLSAASMLVLTTNDIELKAKLDVIVSELKRCQKENGGKWIGSIPEKYFKRLENNQYVWSPQYVMHKTLLGLLHAYIYAHNAVALDILDNAADWYLDWIECAEKTNPHAIYSGEEGGMLEVWATLFEITHDEKYLKLSYAYSNPSIFKKLENGEDPLTDCHENASIPWAHGAAKMYEATGDEKWLALAEKFWNCAVNERESYCTGGQGAGEYWVAKGDLGKFLGKRNQEFCTVYNMVRLADYLYKFTGNAVYAQYIEKNLYNGFLAQQNKFTAMPTYFLPLQSGSHKKWGSKTHDFWCCHGTMVQAQTIYPTLCFYESASENRVVLAQYIPCEYKRSDNVTLTVNADMKYYNDGVFFDENDDSRKSRWSFKMQINAKSPEKFTLSLRIPDWVSSEALIYINGEKVENPEIANGYFDVEKIWQNDVISLYFPASLTVLPLPDMPEKVAIAQGCVVLAGLCDNDCGLVVENGDIESALYNVTEHTYETFPWQQSTYRTKNQNCDVKFIPLYDVTDECYTVYFTLKNK